MKPEFVKRIFEISVIVFGLVILGWYLSSVTKVTTLVVDNEYNVQNDETVQVILGGEVKSPGTYSVKQGTLLYDVIRMAGGVTDKADLSSFDLSLPVVADTTEFIPKKAEGIQAEKEKSGNDKDVSPDDFLNINTASAEDIAKLSGIGDAIADRIVEYRATNGDFEKTEDIKNVKGVGDKIFEKIKDFITVG